MLKNKRIILIVLAVVFLVVLFLAKKTTIFENTVSYIQREQAGLAYDTTIEKLVEKDLDQDGVLDWQEPLYGLDPTKKETTPGIPDITILNKLKIGQENNTEIANGNKQGAESLTQTDKFSRELFSTVASLNQNGAMDQATADQISSSLVSQIQNTPQRKVYLPSDIKVINNNTASAVQKYKNDLINISEKHSAQTSAEDVLTKFVGDGTTLDESALQELTPIIKSEQNIINDWTKIEVPTQLAQAHLDALNAMEGILENESDLLLYDSDPLVAMGALKNYEDSLSLYNSTTDALVNLIDQKL